MLTLNQTKIIATTGMLDVNITREFDAPRALVFKALTDPDYFNKWLNSKEFSITLDKYELKRGGLWRYIYDNHKGTKYAFNGVFHEVLVPERITSTSEIEGLPEDGHVWLKTARFEPLPGDRTKVSVKIVFNSLHFSLVQLFFSSELLYSQNR
jgi:uncharacterized protein YndB with AHSA1/START domain